ncbi:MAG TPA: response regulator [Anaeromyxobacteraceae bacterium]|nr:response regulator [Anaeromyxobacteraceae bacterium]
MTSGRILIVDDERFFRDLFQEMLTARGHQVRVAASGEEALRILAGERFDLLVTDLVMPGVDGISLLRDARARDPELAAVAVTGQEDVKLAVQAMKAGCEDFLTKPVDRAELAAVVERILERARLKREHSALLTENMQFARSQALFRRCMGILATLDLERLQDLTLSVLARITDAQGAALWLADDKGQLQLRAYRGIIERSVLPPRIDLKENDLAGSIRAGNPFAAPGAPPGETFYVPLVVDEEPVGLALLADRASGRFGADEHASALAVADFAAIAVRNARRFQALERLGLRDRETAAYNLSYFVDYAGKEFYKARRYGRQFSLALVSIDNIDQMRKEAGRDLFRAAMRDLVSAVARVVRDADILAKVAENEYYVLLPETDYFGALMFLRRAVEEVRREESVRLLEQRVPLLLSMGAATFPKDGEDFDELLHWCRARTEEQRGSLVRRMHLADLEPSAFWELADILLTESARLPETTPSARRPAEVDLFAAAQREAAREVGRDPRARGLVYLGRPGGADALPLLADLPRPEASWRVGDSPVRIFILGSRGNGEPPLHPLVTPVFVEGDPRLSAHEFLLFLGENAAYGLLQKPGGTLFHTSDVPLVDMLVSKLQAAYDLQPV